MPATAELITTDRLPERCSFEVASVYLGVSFSTVAGLIRRGELQSHKIRNHPFIRREDLIRYATNGTFLRPEAGADSVGV